MYDIDGRESLVPVNAIPRPEGGAPTPIVLAGDIGGATLAYYTKLPLSGNVAEDEVAVLRFGSVHSLMFGAPNDEALAGHPLWSLGLRFYAAYLVEHSSWVRRLERMNSVHHMHRPETFAQMRHYIVTFHDSTFECVCDDAPDVSTAYGSTPLRAATATPG